MEIKDIRRLNLEGLIEKHGTIEALARATGTLANYLSQIRGRSRNMGDTFARKLEASMGAPRGWLDAMRFGSPDQAMDQTEALQILASLSEADRDAWLKHGRLLVGNAPTKGPDNPFGPVAKPPREPGGTQ